MNLYLLSRPDDLPVDYESYESVVVAALSEEEARLIHPDGYSKWGDGYWETWNPRWIAPSRICVRLIGTALEGTVSGVVHKSETGA
jgi:hypothetical protein